MLCVPHRLALEKGGNLASQITTNIIKIGESVDILYGRLSQEDDHTGDSNSIVNQRSYLEKYATDNGFQNPVFMADDGYSGTNFVEVR